MESCLLLNGTSQDSSDILHFQGLEVQNPERFIQLGRPEVPNPKTFPKFEEAGSDKIQETLHQLRQVELANLRKVNKFERRW